MKEKIQEKGDKLSAQPAKAGITRGMSVSLTPESQSILNMMGGEVNSIINDAIVQKGAERGIIPSMIITPDGAKKIEIAGGGNVQNNGHSNDTAQVNSFDEIENMMAKMMRMKMMKQMIDDMSGSSSAKKNDEDGFPNINKMLQLNIAKSMIKDMSGSKDEKDTIGNVINTQMDNLKKEINDNKKWETLVKELKGDETRKFGYEELIKLQGDRDTQIEMMRLEAQKAKDETLMQQFNHKLENLQLAIGSRQNRKEDFSELADTVNAVKSLSEQLGGKAPEKSKFDTARDLIQAAMPALSPLAEAAGDSLRAQREFDNTHPTAQEQHPGTPNEQPHVTEPTPDNVDMNNEYSKITNDNDKESKAQVI